MLNNTFASGSCEPTKAIQINLNGLISRIFHIDSEPWNPKYVRMKIWAPMPPNFHLCHFYVVFKKCTFHIIKWEILSTIQLADRQTGWLGGCSAFFAVRSIFVTLMKQKFYMDNGYDEKLCDIKQNVRWQSLDTTTCFNWFQIVFILELERKAVAGLNRWEVKMEKRRQRWQESNRRWKTTQDLKEGSHMKAIIRSQSWRTDQTLLLRNRKEEILLWMMQSKFNHFYFITAYEHNVAINDLI